MKVLYLMILKGRCGWLLAPENVLQSQRFQVHARYQLPGASSACEADPDRTRDVEQARKSEDQVRKYLSRD